MLTRKQCELALDSAPNPSPAGCLGRLRSTLPWALLLRAPGSRPGTKGCGEGREAGLGLGLGERLELQLGGLLFVMLCVGSI